MGKKDDIRDVLVPAIEKRRALDSLWHLEPAALARRVIKSKYIKHLVHDLLNGDIKQLENLCIKKFPAPTSANGGSETAQAAPPANPASGAPTSSPSAAVNDTGGGNATDSAAAGSVTTTTTTGTADVNTKKASETQATAPAVQLTQEQVAEFWDNLQKVHDEFKDLLPKARAYYQA